MPRTTTISTAVVALALAAPGAATAQQDLRNPDTRDTGAAHQDLRNPDTRDAGAAHQDLRSPDTRDGMPSGSTPAPVVTIPRTRVVTIEQTGFEWGDAAIGGAAAVGALLTAGGLVLTVRPRRRAAAH